MRHAFSLNFRPKFRWTTFINSRSYVSAGTSSTSEPIAAPATSFRLREYQEECIQAVLSYLKNGHKRLGISLATGSGKTVIFAHLIDRVRPPREDATQTLILVHRRELVEQAARHCATAYPSKSIEIEMGSTHASGFADITIASIWSIISKGRILKFDPKRFKLILVDEAHHIVATSFMQTLEHFGLVKGTHPTDCPALVGVSATLSRFDGIRLNDAIDHIVYHKDYIDMIGEKWLSNVIFTTVQSKANISKVHKASNGDFQIGDLSRAVNTHAINEVTVKAWEFRASTRKSTLVFCVDLAHVADLTAAFRTHGVDARYITGETPKQIRHERLEAFKNVEFPVLLNCGIFTEGTDVPIIDCVLLARPTRSRNLLVQMIGRGMRLHHSKENCHIIDMVASLEAGIVTTPTLFGLDPAAVIDEADVDDLKSMDRKAQDDELRKSTAGNDKAPLDRSESPDRTITFTDYDSVYSLIDDTSGERHIRGLSALAWVMVAPNRYILSSQSGSYVAIESSLSTSSHWSVTYTQKTTDNSMVTYETKSPFLRPRTIAESGTMADAVHAADTFVSQKFPWQFVSKSQKWRKMPATRGQLDFLNKLRPMTDQLTPDMLTKGKATDMITKVRFGARGQFQKLKSTQKRQEKGENRLRQAQDARLREEVRVGPLLSL